MFTSEDYLYGWLAYAVGALLLLLCTWMITARLRYVGLRQMLRFLVAVALAVPWYASPDLHYLAPAWVIAAFEGVFDGDFGRAGGPWLAVLGVALVLGLIWQLLRLWLFARRDSPSES